MRSRIVQVLAMVLLLAVGSARADDARVVARRHNAEAEKLFNLGRFREAAAAYQRAYLAKPVPEFLFNIGQCHKRLGTDEDLERAIFHFESYVHNAQNVALRADAKDQIVKLRAELRARRDARRPPPVYKRWWFWTLIGAAVAGATVGTVVALQPADPSPVQGSVGEPSPLQLP
jgi:tetratricopeptide (TPR) repeat protein